MSNPNVFILDFDLSPSNGNIIISFDARLKRIHYNLENGPDVEVSVKKREHL